ncbi:aldo/keto reductase [Salinicola halophilus]|uniref:aldo/keto reductase n=1 Tax=Salinicola halophilus TaxID=184065 RepID=UPI000DA15510|nr:aldo/keto reductase [Salinicola halophilus]
MPLSSPHIVFPATATEPAVTLPAIGQGTWYMGEDRLPASQEADALRHGLDHGMTLIDTAEMYGEGGAEKVVGQALAGRRDDAFVVSKVYPWNAGRDGTIAACERSLARLGIETLDLYLLHWPGSIPLEETFEAFERLREQGKIRRFGVSNFDAERLGALESLPGAADCATDQVLYHLGSRGVEVDVLPWLKARGLPAMAYCPLAQGDRQRNEVITAPVVEAIAAEHGVSAAQILLAWVIRTGAPTASDDERPTIAIPKASTLAHVEANAEALSIQLTADDLARLDDAFPAPDRPVPLDIV